MAERLQLAWGALRLTPASIRFAFFPDSRTSP